MSSVTVTPTIETQQKPEALAVTRAQKRIERAEKPLSSTEEIRILIEFNLSVITEMRRGIISREDKIL